MYSEYTHIAGREVFQDTLLCIVYSKICIIYSNVMYLIVLTCQYYGNDDVICQCAIAIGIDNVNDLFVYFRSGGTYGYGYGYDSDHGWS